MSVKIYSHNNGVSSRLLAEALGIKRLRHKNSRWRPKAGDCIINWGARRIPFNCRIINDPNSVERVSNKSIFFQMHKQYPDTFNAPLSWTDKQAALGWLNANPGKTLVARTLTNSCEGKGIVMVDGFVDGVVLDIVNAPLYTEYVKKRAEYRVHVVNGEAIDVVQKKKKAGHNGGDNRIRNTNNGYVFCRNNIIIPQTVIDNAINAVKFYGLDFGAVDVIYNEHHSKAYVLEINTAPGIEGTTVQKYKEAFNKWLT